MKLLTLLFVLTLVTPLAQAQGKSQAMAVDEQHIQRWNNFFDALLELHQQYMNIYDTLEQESTGGYATQPNFYREVKYYDKKTKLLLSRIQWEQHKPQQAHLVEVFIYDDQGRVDRDYLAVYLPQSRNAPIQTLINLHQYSGNLHSYRQFDASGNRIYEHCEQGKKNSQIILSLDEDDIALFRHGYKKPVNIETYQRCFAGLEETAINYLQPF